MAVAQQAIHAIFVSPWFLVILHHTKYTMNSVDNALWKKIPQQDLHACI